jgi:HAD superfamily hydrolase (TIGR01509 family)
MATVIDTDTLITAIRETTAKHGIELVSFWATTIAAVVSAAALFVIFMQMKAGDRQLSLLAEQIRATKDTIYEKLIAGRAKDLARPGALSLLRYAQISKKSTALATSTTRTGATIILGKNGLNLLNSFNTVVTGDEVKRAKPDPEIYNRVRSQLGDAFTYLVFEDSPSGVASARGAGMSCIAVPNHFTAGQNFAEADLVITSLDHDASVLE